MQPTARTWAHYQERAHRIVYSDFIQNVAFDATPQLLEEIFQLCPNTVLVHGAAHSAGTIKYGPPPQRQ